MEHQVIVPFPVWRVRSALQEADRLARCVPGLRPDNPDPQAVSTVETHPQPELHGRLRVRISGSSITYRGVLRVAAEDDAGDAVRTLVVHGEGEEARGHGGAAASLYVRLSPAEDAEWASRVDFQGSVTASGRLADCAESAMHAAGHRLLDRFVTQLTEELTAEGDLDGGNLAGSGLDGNAAGGSDSGPESVRGAAPADETDGDAPLIDVPDTPAELDSTVGSVDLTGSAGSEEDDLDLPFPSEEFFENEDLTASELGSPEPGTGWPDTSEDRRTMVGRSAEEVDHAPPRGRYAPVPVSVGTPQGAPADGWRWAAVGVVGLVVSSVVAYRVLRSRR